MPKGDGYDSNETSVFTFILEKGHFVVYNFPESNTYYIEITTANEISFNIFNQLVNKMDNRIPAP